MVVNHPQNWMMKNKVSLFVKFPPIWGIFYCKFYWRAYTCHKNKGDIMINSFEDLKKAIPNINPDVKKVVDKYGVHITDYYLSLIDLQNPNDPLYRVVIPSVDELCVKQYELDDPIGDDSDEFETRKTKMLVHRYPDRVLFLTTSKCASRCRYCFRKSCVFGEKDLFDVAEFEKSLDYIKNTKSIREVVLSGGDALCMPRQYFKRLFTFVIENCPHIKGMRINTRACVYEPSLITDDLADFLNMVNKHIPLVFMTHIVHAREITDTFKQAIAKLDCIKLNQTPLLKGVNATIEDLTNLSWALVGVGIVPHYLHYLDKAKGTSHFRVSIDEARKLVGGLLGHISGHLIPKLILDVPGGSGKIWLNPSFIEKEEYDGDKHILTIKSTYSDKVETYCDYVEK